MRGLVRLTAILALLIAASANAQDTRRRAFAADPLTVSADILEASRLLSVNPEAGLRMLRQLNARFPGRDDILARLGYGMQVVGKADSATFYYQAALQANPLNLDAGKALGSIYFGEGRRDQAMRVFDRMLEANGHGVSAYKIVSGALRDLGQTDEAIRVLEEGRRRNKKNQSLTLDIATLYKQSGQNEKALNEYLSFAAAEPRSYRLVRGRMLEVLRESGRERDGLVSYLNTQADRGGTEGFASMDVLAAHYLERGLLENSLNMALRADADPSSDGTTLLALAEDVLVRADLEPRNQRGRYLDMGLRAAEAYVRGHARAPDIDRARWILATIYQRNGSGENPDVPAVERVAFLERAVGEYADIAKRYPGSQLAEQAYIARGDILLRQLKRPDDALDAYKSGSVNARRLGGVYATRIADVYIGTGRNADAENYLKALTRAGNPELAQAGAYYAGLFFAVKGDYATAKDTLTALAEASPSSPYTNDAIATSWVIEEASMFESQSLGDYFAAMKADMVGDTTAMIARYRAIGSRSIADPVRPRALHALGLVLADQGSYDAGVAALRRFLDDYPDNEDCPVVLRDVGAIYEKDLGQYDRALHEYEQVLMQYPEYAMLDDVRRDITRVRKLKEGAVYAP